jgi:hypothetical protein
MDGSTTGIGTHIGVRDTRSQRAGNPTRDVDGGHSERTVEDLEEDPKEKLDQHIKCNVRPPSMCKDVGEEAPRLISATESVGNRR